MLAFAKRAAVSYPSFRAQPGDYFFTRYTSIQGAI